MGLRFQKFATAALVLLVLSLSVSAQGPAPAARFDIGGYSVLGVPQLSSEDFSKIVSPFIGRQKTVEDVQKAQQALQQAYFELGHCSTQVTIATPAPEAGVIIFRLVQTSRPIGRDCAPTTVLQQKSAIPPVAVAPGEVVTRPLADLTGNPVDTPPVAEAKTEIARATMLKPLADGPVTKPLQDRPVAAPSIAVAPVLASKPPAVVAAAPLVVKPEVKPEIIAAAPVAQSAPKIETTPKPEVAPQIAAAPTVATPKPDVIAIAPKSEPLPAPNVEAVARPVDVAPEPKPEVVQPIAVAPKVEAPKTDVIAIAPKPEPAPKVEVVAPPVVAAREPKPEVVQPIAAAPKVEAPKPEVIAVAPKPEPVPAPKVEVVAAPVIAVPKPEVAPQVAVAPKVETSPPAVIAIAPKPEPAPKVEVVASPVVAVPKPEVIAVAPKPEPVTTPKIEAVVPPVVVAPEPRTEVVPQIAVAPKFEASKPEVVAIAPKPESASVPKVEVVAPPAVVVQEPKAEVVPQVAVAPKVETTKVEVVAIAPKPEPPPAPKTEVVAAPVVAVPEPKPEVVPQVAVAPETPKPEVIAIAPKPEPVPAPKIEVVVPPSVVAQKPQVAVAPKVETPKPEVITMTPKSEPAPVPKAEVATAPVVAMPEPKPEVVPQIAVVPKVETSKPEVIAIAPKSEPAPVLKAEVVTAPVVAVPEPKPEVVQPIAVAPKAEAPKPEVIAIAPKPEPAPAPIVEVVAQPAVNAAPVTKPELPVATPEVVVKPIAIAAAPLVESPPVPEVKQEIERAPVRPLQDRPAPPVAAATPEPSPVAVAKAAPAEKIAQVTPPAPATVKAPEPIYVQGSTEPAASTAPADEDAAAAALRFDIARYQIVGNSLLKQDEINGVLRGYTGRQKDFADVQRALEALQTAYTDKGYSAVQVNLPEQELERGEVRFEVVETRIGKIEIQGNERHSNANVLNSLTALRPGSSPNSIEIARNLKLANENASKQTQVALRAGSQDGEVDATVKLIEDDPVKYSASMDNTGTYATGKYRLGFGYQNSNMLDRDHTLTLQYITNPEHPPTVTVFGLGYRIPLYKSGNSVDLIAGYSDVSSGTVSQLFNVSGAGTVLGVRYNQNLDRIDNYEHKFIYGLDYKAFKSNVTFVGSTTPLVPDITVRPVSVTYSGLLRGTASQLDFYATYTQNLFPGGNDGANSDFQERKPGFVNPARAEAKAGYNIVRLGGSYTHQIFGEWQARTVFAAQLTDAALIAGEQFGAGGAESVRGFEERAISNDRGWRANFELYTPDFAPKLQWDGGRVKMLAFFDTATVSRTDRQPGESRGQSIASYGLGLRLQTKNVFSMKVDFAQVYHDGEEDSLRLIKDGRRNSNTLHAAMVWVY